MTYTLTLFDTISNASVFIIQCFTLVGLRNLYEYLCSYGYLRNSLWRENSNLSNQASIRFRLRVNTTVHVRTLAIRKITQKVAIPSSKTGDNSQNIFSDKILCVDNSHWWQGSDWGGLLSRQLQTFVDSGCHLERWCMLYHPALYCVTYVPLSIGLFKRILQESCGWP